MSSAKYREALDQVRAALHGGESRLDQYVPEEPKKIIEEVTDEEYRRIVAQRRDEDFVVGDRTLGYEDSGKELWEDPAVLKAALAERRKAEQEAAAAAARRKANNLAGLATAAASTSSPSKVEPVAPKSTLHQLFQGAAAPVSAVVEPASTIDSHRQRDLDDMLQQMCGEIEAGKIQEEVVPTPPPNPGLSKAKGAKRKPEGSEPAKPRASKKAAARKASEGPVQVEASPAPAAPDPEAAGGAEGAKVKREIVDEPAAQLGPRVKAEPSEDYSAVVKRELIAEEAQAAIKEEPMEEAPVKQEPTDEVPVKQEPMDGVTVKAEPSEEEATGAAQLRAWLQGGSCEGVVVDEEAAARPEPVAGAPPPPLLLEEDGGLWFFFVDAYEDDRANPPRLYLFGKARTAGQPGCYESCCLVVERIERVVHLLLNVADLNDEAAVKEVAARAEAEFDRNCREQCPGVRKIRAKLKYRNYAFEKPTRHGNGELPFLKVVLDSMGQMPLLGMVGEHFSHMFGAQTTMLERVLVRQRIMGPSWLRLKPQSWREDPVKLSYCFTELRVTPNSIVGPKTDEERRELTNLGMPYSSPPLRIMSLAMQTVQRSVQQPHEPIAIACTMHPVINPDVAESERELRNGTQRWSAVRRIDTRPLPRDSERMLADARIAHFQSEAALLTAFLQKVQEFDPDVIVGHSPYSFDLDVLATRMYQLRLQGWQKLGRLKRMKDRIPHVEGGRAGGFWVGNSLTAGRLVVDVMIQAKDLLPKAGAYDLASLAREQLPDIKDLRMVEPENLPRYFDSAVSLCELASLTAVHALCAARLSHTLQILPLSKQLTNLAGNMWNASLQNKRAERNEMLLCHEFHKRKFVLPDRETFASRKRRLNQEGGGAGLDDAEEPEHAAAGAGPRRGKAAYSGGLVLEPKVGLYDEFVMLLDFNSLYPSIIQEHNICFTTVERPNEVQVGQCATEADLLARTRPPDGTLEEGVLPQVLRRLVDSRRRVKADVASERDVRRKQMLEIRQKALKLTANSMYGCLGFQNSRFYAKPLAALITARGRDALQTTITVVQQELQLDVVYGDTDSVFVNTKTKDFDQAMQAAQGIKKSVNKRYKRLEIEIDAVFGRLMLFKKKKYAAMKVVDWEKKKFECELKGLDIVRRDWCELAKTVGESILMQVLNGDGKEEAVQWAHGQLQEIGRLMDSGAIPLQRYVITKGLTKDPRDYPDAKNQPHVQVALRMMARGKAIRPGQEIAYVVCQVAGEGTKTSLADAARHPHELSLDPKLKVDVAWYKKQQVHPVVSRLLAPLEGTDAARLAECLGLDGTRFARAAAAEAAAGDADAAWAQTASTDVNALFDRKVRWKDYQGSLPGVKCTKCQQTTSWKELLQPAEAWQANGVSAMFCCAHCPEKIAPKRAQNLMVMQLRSLLREHCEGWVRCPGDEVIEKTRRLTMGQNMVSSRMVLRELEYMQFLCEAEGSYAGQEHRGCREAAAGMRHTVEWLLETNGFNWVDCGKIFGGIFGEKLPPRPDRPLPIGNI